MDQEKAMELKLKALEADGLVARVAKNDKVQATSPAFPVHDKGKDTPRVVISMKAVNQCIDLMFAAMPITERTVSRVMQASHVIGSDAKSGWPQMGMTPFTQMVFVFITASSLWKSDGLPFGYKNAPQLMFSG